jgi:hypothetical protein
MDERMFAYRADDHGGRRLADSRPKSAAGDPAVFFTTPHFDGYPAILVQLDRIAPEELDEVIVEAWLARAPKRLVKEYLGERG